MQLRAQMAMQAVHERQLNAEADMLAQHAQFYKQQAAQRQEQLANESAFKAAVGDTFQKHLAEATDPETGEVDTGTAVARTGAVLSKFDPDLANKFVESQARVINPQLRLQGQQVTAQSRVTAAGMRGRLDPFQQAWQGYQQAMNEGDDQQAKLFLSRVQKLAGTLPSPALKEGQDLASTKQSLDQVNEALQEVPNDRGLKAEQRRLQAIVDSMESRHGMEETEISTPGGPTVRITKGGKKVPGALTQAETTRYGEDIQATGNALRTLNSLSDQLAKGGAVGLGPKILHTIYDEYLAQIDPEITDKNRATARENILIGTQQVLGELNSKGRMSVPELHAIQQAMPSLGAGEATPNAQIKLNSLRITLAEKNAAAAEQLKRPVAREALQALSEVFPNTPEGMQALMNEVTHGQISPEVARQVRAWGKRTSAK